MRYFVIMVTTLLLCCVSTHAQLTKLWEYELPGHFDNRNIHSFDIINQDEVVFLTRLGTFKNANIGFGKINSDGSTGWYNTIDLGNATSFSHLTILDNSDISFVVSDKLYDPYLSAFTQYKYEYSPDGILHSATLLSKSIYAFLGDEAAIGEFVINPSGDAVSVTNIGWDVTCPDGSIFNGSSAYALDYYYNGSGTVGWEDNVSKTDYIGNRAVFNGFNSDGSFVVTNYKSDWTSNNCPADNVVGPVYTVSINKYSSSGVALWSVKPSQVHGAIIAQSDSYVIYRSYGPWTDQRITAFNMNDGSLAWEYRMTNSHVPRNADIYEDRLLVRCDYTDSNDRTVAIFYMFDLTTGSVLYTHQIDDFRDLGTNWFDSNGAIYLLYRDATSAQYVVSKCDLDFNELSNGIVEWSSELLGVDGLNNIYLLSDRYGLPTKIIKYSQGFDISVKDASHNDLSNQEMYLIRVNSNAPVYTEDTLGTVSTDADGTIKLTPVN